MSDPIKIHMVPSPLFADGGAFPTKFTNRLIILNPSDIKPYEPLAPREPDKVDGYDFVREESQYFYDGLCRSCGHKTTRVSTDASSWVHTHLCPECSGITIVNEGDKMGGGFDHLTIYSKKT